MSLFCPNPLCRVYRQTKSEKGLNIHFYYSPLCANYLSNGSQTAPVAVTNSVPSFRSTQTATLRSAGTGLTPPPDLLPPEAAVVGPPPESMIDEDTQVAHGDSGEEQQFELGDEDGFPSHSNQDSPGRPCNTYDFMGTDVVEKKSFREWVKEWIRFSKSRVPGDDEPPSNTHLLELLLTNPNFSPGWSSFSKSKKAELSLLNMLNSVKGCPLYLYDDIVKWAKDNFSSPDSSTGDEAHDNIASMLRTREACLSHFEAMAHTTSMKPETQEHFPLKHSSGTVPLTKLPLVGTLYNKLTDVDLMQDNKLLINGASPYTAPDKIPDVLNDINTGSRYISAYSNLKKDKIDLPLPIIPFIDASVLDRGDRLSTEMIAFTLGLFYCATRYMSQA